MLLRRPRHFDPQNANGINWGHSRAERLAFFAPLSVSHGLRDLVSGNTFTRTGLNSGVSVGQVQSRLFGASNYANFTPPASIGPTTPFSVAWTQVAVGTSAYSAILHCNFGTAGVHAPFLVYQAAADLSYQFTAGPSASSSAIRFSTGLVSNWAVNRFVLRVAGGSQDTTAANYTLYRNGVSIGQLAKSSFVGLTTGGARIGALLSGGDPWEGGIADLRMWSRVLTEQEAAEESRIELATELYEFRRIWVPVSAGVGADPQTVSVPAAALSLTGYAPTVTATANQTVAVPAGSLTLTAYAPTVIEGNNQTVSVPAGALTLTGYAPDVQVAATGTTVQVPVATLSLTGFAPTVVAPATITIPAGSLTLTALAPTVIVRADQVVAVPLGELNLTGYAPLVATTGIVSVPAGALTLTGYAPTVLNGEEPPADELSGRIVRRRRTKFPKPPEAPEVVEAPEEPKPVAPSSVLDGMQLVVEQANKAIKKARVASARRRLQIDQEDERAIEKALLEWF